MEQLKRQPWSQTLELSCSPLPEDNGQEFQRCLKQDPIWSELVTREDTYIGRTKVRRMHNAMIACGPTITAPHIEEAAVASVAHLQPLRDRRNNCFVSKIWAFRKHDSARPSRSLVLRRNSMQEELATFGVVHLLKALLEWGGGTLYLQRPGDSVVIPSMWLHAVVTVFDPCLPPELQRCLLIGPVTLPVWEPRMLIRGLRVYPDDRSSQERRSYQRKPKKLEFELWSAACGQTRPDFSRFRRAPAHYLNQWQAKIPPPERALVCRIWAEQDAVGLRQRPRSLSPQRR